MQQIPKKIMGRAIYVFGNEDKAREWFFRFNVALNETPSDALNREHGYEIVIDELNKLEYGVIG
jgi:uncharacterized protein (DUF2384 family)